MELLHGLLVLQSLVALFLLLFSRCFFITFGTQVLPSIVDVVLLTSIATLSWLGHMNSFKVVDHTFFAKVREADRFVSLVIINFRVISSEFSLHSILLLFLPKFLELDPFLLLPELITGSHIKSSWVGVSECAFALLCSRLLLVVLIRLSPKGPWLTQFFNSLSRILFLQVLGWLIGSLLLFALQGHSQPFKGGLHLHC